MTDPSERVRADFDQIISDLNRYSSIQREVAMLGMFSDFIRFGAAKAAELEKAGYPEQAEALRARLAEMMPDAASMPALPELPGPPAVNGAPVPLPRRRGRPPRSGGSPP